MKVALLTPWFVSEQSVGGTERFVNDLAYSLVGNGYAVDVYMLSGKSYKHRNINYISLDLFGNNVEADEYMLTDKFGKFDKVEVYENFAKVINEHVNLDEYDVVQLNSHMFLKVKAKSKIITMHSNYDEFKILGTLEEFNLMKNIIIDEIDTNKLKVVVPSWYYKSVWESEINRDIYCIPHALNRKRLVCKIPKNKLIDKYDVDVNKIKILLPSRLEFVQKQPQMVIDALGMMNEKDRSKFQVLFTGLDTQYHNNMKILESRSKELNIDSKFIVFDCISEGYKITDIVLLPSSSESFGYSAIEGLSLGIKTLLTDIPTYNEFSKKSNCAYVFGTNAEDLCKVLLSLLDENNGRRRISKDWYSDYDLDKFGIRYLELK